MLSDTRDTGRRMWFNFGVAFSVALHMAVLALALVLSYRAPSKAVSRHVVYSRIKDANNQQQIKLFDSVMI